MRSKKISDLTDPRLLGVMAVATDPLMHELAVKWAFWVKGYLAAGKPLMVIDRAAFMLPMPIDVYNALGRKTFDGTDVETACMDMASASGWTPNNLLYMIGMESFEGYSALALSCLVTIRGQIEDDEITSWRAFAAILKRDDMECAG